MRTAVTMTERERKLQITPFGPIFSVKLSKYLTMDSIPFTERQREKRTKWTALRHGMKNAIFSF